jgi:hypothetical protein
LDGLLKGGRAAWAQLGASGVRGLFRLAGTIKQEKLL